MQDPQRELSETPVQADAAGDGAANPLASRAIRSFVLRQGRVSSAQLRHLDEMMPRIGIPYGPAPLDLAAAFGRAAPTVFEIGFGMGETSAKIAAARPDTNFIEVEVHTPGVGSLCKLVAEGGIPNIRIIQHDAVEVLQHMIPEASLAGAHIYFPDPWPKKRHHKRRLVQPPLIALLASRLAPGGYLHCATDWEEYALQMVEVLGAEPLLENTAGPENGGFAPRPDYRPLTKFEQRGLRLGHGVWDVIFRKKG